MTRLEKEIQSSVHKFWNEHNRIMSLRKKVMVGVFIFSGLMIVAIPFSMKGFYDATYESVLSYLEDK